MVQRSIATVPGYFMQPGTGGGKLPVGEDNCLTAYRNGGILHRVLQNIRLLCLMGIIFLL